MLRHPQPFHVITMLQCKTCLQTLEESCFYTCKSSVSGYVGTCKACRVAKQKIYAKSHREQCNANYKAWVARNPKKAVLTARVRSATYRLKHPENRVKYIPTNRERWIVSTTQKPLVLKRDNYCCVLCGENKNLKCHHILPRKYISDSSKLHDITNLITLCEGCHLTKAHSGNYKKLDLLLTPTLLLMAENNSLSMV